MKCLKCKQEIPDYEEGNLEICQQCIEDILQMIREAIEQARMPYRGYEEG